jgi:hypothetical protein
MVPLAGIEPARPKATDFESAASTNSATGATRRDPQSGPVEGGDYSQGRQRVNHNYDPSVALTPEAA